MNTIDFMVHKYYNKIAKYIKLNILKIIWNNIFKKINKKICINLNYLKK